MNRFSTDREALDFISSLIADEAKREGLPLSEIERKMLYFSETAWTLPDIRQISDEFDRAYDQHDYEKKISKLIKNAVAHARRENPAEFKACREAIYRLREEDRYLLVMVDQAGSGLKFHRSSARVLRRLQALGIIAVAVFWGVVWLINARFPETNLPPDARGRLDFAFWLAIVCFAVLAEIVLQLSRFSGTVRRALDWILGIPKSRRS